VLVESDTLVAFGDGIEDDRLTLTWGQRVTVGITARTLATVAQRQDDRRVLLLATAPLVARPRYEGATEAPGSAGYVCRGGRAVDLVALVGQPNGVRPTGVPRPVGPSQPMSAVHTRASNVKTEQSTIAIVRWPCGVPREVVGLHQVCRAEADRLGGRERRGRALRRQHLRVAQQVRRSAKGQRSGLWSERPGAKRCAKRRDRRVGDGPRQSGNGGRRRLRPGRNGK